MKYLIRILERDEKGKYNKNVFNKVISLDDLHEIISKLKEMPKLR